MSESAQPRLTIATLFRRSIAAFRRDNASRFGAALAFYIVFSISPILLIVISIAGLAFGRTAEGRIFGVLNSAFGSATATAISEMIRDAATSTVGWLASTISLITLFFGASGVYRQIDDALHTIWAIPRLPYRGAMNAIRREAISIALVVGVGSWLLALAIADAAIAFTGRYAAAHLLGGAVLWQTAQLIVSVAVQALMFAALFRYVPDTRVPWRDVRISALSTALLFVLGKLALALYLRKAAVGSMFGAAGSIVVVLVWAYWSAQILFFGLELTHEYATAGEGSP